MRKSGENGQNMILVQAGEEKCLAIMCLKNGIYDSLKGINEVMKDEMGGIVYFGNGVGYDRYILVKKQRNG